MAKSLIRTVDGIGIWVRDDQFETESFFGIREIIVYTIVCILNIVVDFYFINNSLLVLSFATDAFGLLLIDFLIFVVCIIIFCYTDFCWRNVPAYEIYPGSEKGIIIRKTSDQKSDQIAICKAAQEIESRCHEITAKRRELDRIAAGCK